MMVKAAVFDLDGTLYPYFRLLSASLSLACRHPRFFSEFARVRVALRQVRPIANFHLLQAELLAERLRVPVDRAGRLIEEIAYGRMEEQFRSVRPFPGIRSLLGELKAAGYRLALLSDFPVQRKLRYLGLDGVWDHAFCSEETGYLKPNPEPFLEAAARLGLEPSEIIYVGDKYHYDVLGAHGVGMRTAHLARVPKAGGVADVTFRSYENFASLVDGLEAVARPRSLQS